MSYKVMRVEGKFRKTKKGGCDYEEDSSIGHFSHRSFWLCGLAHRFLCLSLAHPLVHGLFYHVHCQRPIIEIGELVLETRDWRLTGLQSSLTNKLL